jgi:hypothetical protein
MELGCSPSSGEASPITNMLHLAGIEPGPPTMTAPGSEYFTKELACQLLICLFGTSAEGQIGIFKQSMGARNRVGIGLSYRTASLHRLAEWIPWNRLLGSY